MAWRALRATFWAFLFLPIIGLGASTAQQLGTVQSPILTIEGERLFSASAFGQRILAELEAESAVLSAENQRIEAELIKEESTLTERRATMEPEAFRALADAFDEKVQSFRRTQDAKSRELNQQLERERRVFLQAVAPVLEQLLREAGAAVVLERGSVFLSLNAIDITDTAIARINATLGDGARPAEE